MRHLLCGSYLPADGEVGVVFLEVDRLGVPLSSKSRSEPVRGVQHPGISSLGRKEHQRADGDKASIVLSGPPLNVVDFLGEAKLLACRPSFARSSLDLFTVHVVLQASVESSSHGTVHEAFRRVFPLCILSIKILFSCEDFQFVLVLIVVVLVLEWRS